MCLVVWIVSINLESAEIIKIAFYVDFMSGIKRALRVNTGWNSRGDLDRIALCMANNFKVPLDEKNFFRRRTSSICTDL